MHVWCYLSLLILVTHSIHSFSTLSLSWQQMQFNDPMIMLLKSKIINAFILIPKTIVSLKTFSYQCIYYEKNIPVIALYFQFSSLKIIALFSFVCVTTFCYLSNIFLSSLTNYNILLQFSYFKHVSFWKN